jgi:hypothetical protein
MADGETVAAADLVYRRVRDDGANVVRAVDGAVVRASSAAFEDDVDGMSVFVASVLEATGLLPEDVIAELDGDYIVAEIPVSELHALHLDVIWKPNPPDAPAHRCAGAHALVLFPNNMSGGQKLKIGKRLAKLARLISVDE